MKIRSGFVSNSSSSSFLLFCNKPLVTKGEFELEIFSSVIAEYLGQKLNDKDVFHRMFVDNIKALYRDDRLKIDKIEDHKWFLECDHVKKIVSRLNDKYEFKYYFEIENDVPMLDFISKNNLKETDDCCIIEVG